MAIIPIYNCYHPILRKKTENIENINDELVQFVNNMWDTLRSIPNGIGLAANQVGQSKSVIIINTEKDEDSTLPPLTMLNPVIEYFSDEENSFEEGCLSIPEYYEKVERPAQIQVKFYDLNMKEYSLELDDFIARVVQHEVDHLNAILFFDRITPLKRALAKSKLRKIEQGVVIPDYPFILPDGTPTFLNGTNTEVK